MLTEVLGQRFRLLCGVYFVALGILREVGLMRQLDEVVAFWRSDGVVDEASPTVGEEADRCHLDRPDVIIGLGGCRVLSLVPKDVGHLLVVGILEGIDDEGGIFRLVPEQESVGVVERFLAHLNLPDNCFDLQTCNLMVPRFLQHTVRCVKLNTICQGMVVVR